MYNYNHLALFKRVSEFLISSRRRSIRPVRSIPRYIQEGLGRYLDIQKGLGLYLDIQKGLGLYLDIQKGLGLYLDIQKGLALYLDIPR